MKKIFIIITVIVVVLLGVGLFTHYIDSARVRNNVEPKFTIKTVSDDGSKITYWGLGYKIIRYVGVSPKEPYQSNIGVKMGNWFMKYELPQNETTSDIIYIELIFDGDKIEITDDKEIETIEKIVLSKKYNEPLCDGMSSHKITIGNEIYYIMEWCEAIRKGDKQAEISDEDLKIIKDIINNNLNKNSTTTEPYIPEGMDSLTQDNIETGKEKEYNRSPENVKIEVIEDTITNTGLSIIITDNNEDYYGWGVDFKVEKKIDDGWKCLEPVSEDLSWIEIAYVPNEDNQIKQKLDIEKYYGKLTNGTYRIVKSVYDKGYIDLYSNEFEIIMKEYYSEQY